MSYCNNCGEELIEDAKFCSNCGIAVKIPENVRKTTYDGVVHKCPNCGDTVDAYETVCETCGYEIRGRNATSVVHELAIKLGKTDDVQKKEELIRTFYIPNTKEDILEFFILATSNIEVGGSDMKAWIAKLEQAYQKAELSLSGAPEFERLKVLYKKALGKSKFNKTFGFLRSMGDFFKSKYVWAVIGALCFYLFFFGPFSYFSIQEQKHEDHVAYLETLVVEVEKLIEDGDYEAARIKASQVVDDVNWSSESEEKWDSVRETLLDTIDKKEKESKGKK